MKFSDVIDQKAMDKMMKQAQKAGKKAAKWADFDEMLKMAGLRRRSVAADIAADIGFFTIGCLCGAAVGLFFAPKPGMEIREDFKKAISEKGMWGGVGQGMKEQIGTQA